jgi:energy-coupling factor transporter ATP-binding protein EcfA2
MHITKVELQNIRNIRELTWELPADHLAGWHVLLGDNGSGKTTVLRAISGVLLGDSSRNLQFDPYNLINKEFIGKNEGEFYLVRLTIKPIEENPLHRKAETDVLEHQPFELGLTVNPKFESFQKFYSPEFTIGKIHQSDSDSGKCDFWSVPNGWFSVAYGSFRRLVGSEQTLQELQSKHGDVSAHISLHHAGVALSEYRQWLTILSFTALKSNDDERTKQLSGFLNMLKLFINQILPNSVQFHDVVPQNDSVSIQFIDSNDLSVDILELAEGYQSILAWVFDLLRRLTFYHPDYDVFSWGKDNKNNPIVTVKTYGVVLIDEVDAHLHPSWQRKIGYTLTNLFPNIQFIVTTHSPLVCQAAVRGSIFRLPTPGTDEEARPVERSSEEWKQLVYGNILESYGTNLFGNDIDRSPEALEKYQRVGELARKQIQQELTPEEEQELATLQAELPNTPYTTRTRARVRE